MTVEHFQYDPWLDLPILVPEPSEISSSVWWCHNICQAMGTEEKTLGCSCCLRIPSSLHTTSPSVPFIRETYLWNLTLLLSRLFFKICYLTLDCVLETRFSKLPDPFGRFKMLIVTYTGSSSSHYRVQMPSVPIQLLEGNLSVKYRLPTFFKNHNKEFHPSQPLIFFKVWIEEDLETDGSGWSSYLL